MQNNVFSRHKKKNNTIKTVLFNLILRTLNGARRRKFYYVFYDYFLMYAPILIKNRQIKMIFESSLDSSCCDSKLVISI